MSFWDVMFTIFACSIFIAYLILLFHIVGDLFRRDMSGVGKALWVAALIFFTVITSIVYIAVRGSDTRPYPGSQSGGDEMARAKEMLDSGALDQAEYEAIKRRTMKPA